VQKKLMTAWDSLWRLVGKQQKDGLEYGFYYFLPGSCWLFDRKTLSTTYAGIHRLFKRQM
jgi:hypothetical protein